jgi:periplasmic copper chaperone A
MKHILSATLTALAILTTVPLGALAGSQDVAVENAWARASIGMDRPGAAYMDVRNAGAEPVTLIGLKTELAMMPEIHRTSTNADGVSSMAPAGEIMIAPGETVTLEPGGLHAMLMRLRAPMNEGETFTLMLLFSDGGEVKVDVPILGFAARGPED